MAPLLNLPLNAFIHCENIHKRAHSRAGFARDRFLQNGIHACIILRITAVLKGVPGDPSHLGVGNRSKMNVDER